MKSKILLIGLIISVVLLSGCVSDTADVTSYVKSLPEVNAFLEEHPNATIKAVLWSEDYVSSNIESIRNECGEQVPVSSYYYVTIEENEEKIRLWLNSDTRVLVCLIKEGTEPAPPTFGDGGDRGSSGSGGGGPSEPTSGPGDDDPPEPGPGDEGQPSDDDAPLISIMNPEENSEIEEEWVKIELITNENAACSSRLTTYSKGGDLGREIGGYCDKYYSCPDGSVVKYCEMSGGTNYAACGCKSDPESLCPSGGGENQAEWKEMDTTGGTEHFHGQFLTPGIPHKLEFKCADENENEDSESVSFTVKSKYSNYLIEEDIGNYKYVKSIETEPSMHFSDKFVKGFTAIYHQNSYRESVAVSVWIFESGKNLNEDLENYIFEKINPLTNMPRIGLHGSSDIIGISRGDGMEYLWPSGNRIIHVNQSSNALPMIKYSEKYSSAFKPTKTCIDSDGGKNYGQEGYVEYLVDGPNGQYAAFDDSCAHTSYNQLREGYCENGKFKMETYNCPDQCIYAPESDIFDSCGKLEEPDFIVQEITMSIAEPKLDDLLSFPVTIKNIGNGSGSGMMERSCVLVYPSGEQRGAGGGINAVITPGETRSLGGCGFPLTEEGTYTYTEKVDSDNWVAESSETNNEKTITFNVSGERIIRCRDTDYGIDYYDTDEDYGLNYHGDGDVTVTNTETGLTITISDFCLDDIVELATQYPTYQTVLENMINAGVIEASQVNNPNILIESYCPSNIRNDYDIFDFETAYSCTNGCSGEPGTGAAATGVCALAAGGGGGGGGGGSSG